MPIPRLCPSCQIVVYTGERHCKIHNIPMRAICQGCKKDVCTISKWARHAKKCEKYQNFLRRSEQELQPNLMKDDDHDNRGSSINLNSEPPTPPMNMNFTPTQTMPSNNQKNTYFDTLSDSTTLTNSLNKLLNYQQKVPDQIRMQHQQNQTQFFEEPMQPTINDVLPSLKDLPVLSQQRPRKRLVRPRAEASLQKCMLHYGPTTGNQFVAVYGSFDFYHTDPVQLYFGSSVAHVVDVHPGHIHCLTPSVSQPGRVKVTLTVHSSNEVKMPNSEAYYDYIGPPSQDSNNQNGGSNTLSSQDSTNGPSNMDSTPSLFEMNTPTTSSFPSNNDFLDLDDPSDLFQLTFCKNMYGHTMLHLCVINSWISKLKYVISLNMDILATDNFGRTPFHYAAIKNDLAALKQLVGSKQFQHLSELQRNDLFHDIQDYFGNTVADYTTESFFQYVDYQLSTLDMVRHYHQFEKFYENTQLVEFNEVHPSTPYDSYTNAKFHPESNSIYLISRRRRLHFRYDPSHFLSLHKFDLDTRELDMVTFQNEPDRLNFYGTLDSTMVNWDHYFFIQAMKDTFVIYNLKTHRVHFTTLRPNLQGVPMTYTNWFHPKLGLFFSMEENRLVVADLIGEKIDTDGLPKMPFVEGNLKFAATCLSNDYRTLFVSFGIFDNNPTSFLYNRELSYNDGLYAYDLFNKEWSVLSRHPQLVRTNHSMTTLPGRKNELLIIGGSHQEKGYLNDVWIFSNNNWRCVHVHGAPFIGNKFTVITCPSSQSGNVNSPYFWKDVKHACVLNEDHEDDDELELKRFDLLDSYQTPSISKPSFSLYAIGGVSATQDNYKTFSSFQMNFSAVQENFLKSTFPHFTDMTVDFS
mmetsp:Transcript_6836/g.9982  ORF Transcript_6836/g.9982 Transcript_6836/m.9982 type:complete len:857 (-) Transcript_6836:7-2577(-)